MKKIYLLLVLVSFSFCLSFMSSTYSRYVAGTTGNIDIPFAKWQILLNTQDITSQNNSQLTFTPVIETSQNTNAGTIAPSSKGYFDISINPENVDVSFSYAISLSIDSENLPDIIITKYAILPDNYVEGDTLQYSTISNNIIENSLYYNNNTPNFSFSEFTIRVYFEWIENDQSEIMDDDDDTQVGLEAAEDETTFNISANISFEQIV